MIPERTVIRMFLHRHELDCIIACTFDPGQYFFLKFPESPDFTLFLCHARMGFVNEKRFVFICFANRAFPLIFYRRIPHLRVENKGVRILDNPCCSAWYPVPRTAFPCYFQPVKIFMTEGVNIKMFFPYSIFTCF